MMFPEGQLTKIAECCQLSLDSDKLRLEHRLPAVDGDCYTGCNSVTSVSGRCQLSIKSLRLSQCTVECSESCLTAYILDQIY